MVGEGLKFLEGDVAEEVFDAVNVFFLGLVGDSEDGEEVGEDLVAFGDFFADFLAFFCEFEVGVGLVNDEFFFVEALHHLSDGGLADIESAGKVGDADAFLGLGEFVEGFEVIFLFHGGKSFIKLLVKKARFTWLFRLCLAYNSFLAFLLGFVKGGRFYLVGDGARK